MSDGGKGSAPRKNQNYAAFTEGYERIFNRKNKLEEKRDREMKLNGVSARGKSPKNIGSENEI